jgi:hypothetical protein
VVFENLLPVVYGYHPLSINHQIAGDFIRHG